MQVHAGRLMTHEVAAKVEDVCRRYDLDLLRDLHPVCKRQKNDLMPAQSKMVHSMGHPTHEDASEVHMGHVDMARNGTFM
jgi:hypothetical protein